MSLKDRITDDMKDAMRAKDAPRLLTIRGLLAALKQKEVDERVVLTDEMVIAIVDKLIKQRKDSISQFAAAQRTDLVEKESAELALLEQYLPTRMAPDEIQGAIAEIVSRLGATGLADIGKVMAAAKAELAGKAEMASVAAAVKQALSK